MFSSLLALPSLASAVLGLASMRSADGSMIRWGLDRCADGPYIALIGNPAGGSGQFDDTAFARAVVTGLQTWSSATDGKIQFDYWQTRDPALHPAALQSDGISTIFFASQNTGLFGPGVDSPLASGPAAHTQLWLDQASKNIVEFDIVLNDLEYEFVSHTIAGYPAPEFLLAYNRRIILEDTIAHELGHAIGLDHSARMNTTMYAFGWYEQGLTSCEDRLRARRLYELPDPDMGSLAGKVMGPSGQPILGASVTALSPSNLNLRLSTLSDRAGDFRLDGLPPGDWMILVEPVPVDAISLSQYYEPRDHTLCTLANGFPAAFSRTFQFEGAGPQIARHTVRSGELTSADTLVVDCGQFDSGVVVPEKANTTDVPELWQHARVDVATGWQSVAIIDRFEGTDSSQIQSYRLDNLSGPLRIRIASHSLFSPVRVEMRLTDASGLAVEQTLHAPLATEQRWRKFVDYDALLQVAALAPGNYELEVEVWPLDKGVVVDAERSADATPFYLLSILSGTSEAAPSSEELCGGDRSTWPMYQIPTRPLGTPRCDADQPVEDEDAAMGCALSRHRPRPSAMASALLLIGLLRQRRR